MELNLPLLLLALLVFVAGLIDSIAGGGGLITLPAYLNYKIPESLLLGTNKLSSTLGTFAATIKYLSEIRFPKEYLLTITIFSALFSSIGAFAISLIPPLAIKILVLTLLPPLSLWISLSKEFGIKDYTLTLPEKIKNLKTILLCSTISFYDGAMGPATGTFLAVGYSRYIGYDILKATALAKFTNLISNISALIVFIALKKVELKLGFLMGIISMIGNLLGAKMTLKKGIWIIKPLLIAVSNLIILKLLFETIKEYGI